MNPLTLSVPPSLSITDEQFYELCVANQDLQLERTAKGEIIIMPPTGGETSNRNSGLTAQVWVWNEQSQLGKVFDSSGGFKLPNGAERAPDVAWVSLDKWNRLTQQQREKFPPVCPDFVIELRSPNDSLKLLQEKMQEYQENGARLGWLINPKQQQVEIYRIGRDKEILDAPMTLLGEDVLPGFVLNLRSIWS